MEENTMYLKHDHSGQRSTAIGLACGLGGGALLFAIAGLWGLNSASKARSDGAMALATSNAQMINALNNGLVSERAYTQSALASERNSREGWQYANQPTIKSYIDVNATPSASSTSLSEAAAIASAIASNNNALNGAISTDSFLKVARYSAPSPCGCDSCSNS